MNICGATYQTFRCTREESHDGDHVSTIGPYQAQSYDVLAHWPNHNQWPYKSLVLPDAPGRDDPNHPVNQIADMIGGTVEELKALPDGSGYGVIASTLPKDHWLYTETAGYEPPPMPFRMGKEDELLFLMIRRPTESGSSTVCLKKEQVIARLQSAARYAIRASTDNGKQDDFDPDALVQNFVVGLLGYHTATGLSSDEWANPQTRGGDTKTVY